MESTTLATTATSNSILQQPSNFYELGRDAALYALYKSPFTFPSRIERRRRLQLRVTVGSIKISDILSNTETVFKGVKLGHRRVGITLFMDKIATNGQLYYLPETDECAAFEGASVR